MNESRGGAGGATGARVVLRSVSDVDRAALLDLRVAPHQACFVSDSAATLDEAAAMPEAYVRAVCVSEEAVGLVMYGLDREEKAPWIYRFLIDQRHQGRGLGAPHWKRPCMKWPSSFLCGVLCSLVFGPKIPTPVCCTNGMGSSRMAELLGARSYCAGHCDRGTGAASQSLPVLDLFCKRLKSLFRRVGHSGILIRDHLAQDRRCGGVGAFL